MSSPKKFGRYEIERRLGAGAMGEVYVASDPQIERLLALKTVKLEGVPEKDRPMLRDRLLFEAKAAGQLVHPNVVTLFDTGEDDGIVYLAFEYVEGCHLGERVGREPKLTLGDVLRITRQVASALDLAQTRGIVHRDIKPSNILIDKSGTAKVADFGIAKMRDRASDLTVTGAIIGTPHYMSPEQIRTDPLDGRSDVFSLGAVLFELLHRERPFRGETITTLVYQILHHDPLPAMREDLPPALRQLLRDMLAKEVDDRLWAGEVVERLDPMLRKWPDELLSTPIARKPMPRLEVDPLAETAPAKTPPPPPAPPAPPAAVDPTVRLDDSAATRAEASAPTAATASPGTVPRKAGTAASEVPPQPASAPFAGTASATSSGGSLLRSPWLWVGGCLGAAVLLTLIGVFVLSRPIERWLSGRQAPGEEATVAQQSVGETGEEVEAEPGSATERGEAPRSQPLEASTESDQAPLIGSRPDGPGAGSDGADRSPSSAGRREGREASATAAEPTRQPAQRPPPRSEAGERTSRPAATTSEPSPGRTDPAPSSTTSRDPAPVERPASADPPAAREAEPQTAAEEADPGAADEPAAAPTPVPPDKVLESGTSLLFDVQPEDAYILFRRVGDARFLQIGQVEDHRAGKRRARPWDLPGAGTYEMILRAPGKRDYLLLLEARRGGQTTIQAVLQPGQPGGASPD
ncbi:MAG: serine/threonine protein kinase [Acidobacteria bacterium]|nr:MAG: serine/threonine protein kinase [Acidobacteriota bacterium]REK10323.1 MAG: serine/threonine protein kinase [Acidobacteriota bacterium]